MNFKHFFFTISIIFSFNCVYTQPIDTIYGKVKKIREKVVFLTEIENPQLLYYDDYGHYGFRGPDVTKTVFKDDWYNTENCYFINYERHFDANANVVLDLWFTKEDSLMNTYQYTYDESNRLKQEINTSENNTSIKNYYHKKGGHLDIIEQNSDVSYFFHKYEKYDKNGKLLREIRYHNKGNIKEYIYNYDENSNLKYIITGNLIDFNDYTQFKEKKFNVDSIDNYYKSTINTYNENNQLIKYQKLIKRYRNNKIYIENYHTINKEYEGEKVVKTSGAYSDNKPSFFYYDYDEKNRIIAKYCCSENKKDAFRIRNYTYNGDQIQSLSITRHLKEGTKVDSIKFSYKFDDKNNWIEILKTVNGVKRYKWIRTIEY
ncbi:hypothetical protein [Flavobacteriaceae bacterium 14752]|uniref:hypothetical protein n=1 Tax=Mesohalobacter salilacus TaxID=2491711 RepID=UPI000F6382AE|nr:hypothetical protein EIG84_06485 [Flavobacteriaceae bacterium 14752]